MPHQALCIISLTYVNSNWSYGPETANLAFDFSDLDLRPWLFAWPYITSVDGNGSNCWKFHDDSVIRWWEHSEKGVTDGRTDRWTDWTIYRAAWSQLKRPQPPPTVDNDLHTYHITVLLQNTCWFKATKSIQCLCNIRQIVRNYFSWIWISLTCGPTSQ